VGLLPLGVLYVDEVPSVLFAVGKEVVTIDCVLEQDVMLRGPGEIREFINRPAIETYE
jgi:hypothetical protein